MTYCPMIGMNSSHATWVIYQPHCASRYYRANNTYQDTKDEDTAKNKNWSKKVNCHKPTDQTVGSKLAPFHYIIPTNE